MFKTRTPREQVVTQIVHELFQIWSQINDMSENRTPYSEEKLESLRETSWHIVGDIPFQFDVIQQNAFDLKKAHNRDYLQEIQTLHTNVMNTVVGKQLYFPQELDELATQAEQIVADCPDALRNKATLYLEWIQSNVQFLKRLRAPIVEGAE